MSTEDTLFKSEEERTRKEHEMAAMLYQVYEEVGNIDVTLDWFVRLTLQGMKANCADDLHKTCGVIEGFNHAWQHFCKKIGRKVDYAYFDKLLETDPDFMHKAIEHATSELFDEFTIILITNKGEQ